MNRDVQRYLRHATRGLWGQRRRTLQAELQGHIEARIHEFQIAGHDVAEATRLTLNELGGPARISTAMVRLYITPGAARTSVLMGLLALVSIQPLKSAPLQLGIPQAEATSGFWRKPYAPGTARPIPIPTCSNARYLQITTRKVPAVIQPSQPMTTMPQCPAEKTKRIKGPSLKE